MPQGNLAVNDLKYEFADEDRSLGTRIKVIGVGGGGSNAIARMMDNGLAGVQFYVINTDQQALMASPARNKLAIGARITGGLGVGSDPAVGRKAALDDTERIIELLEGADMVFVTAGLGGGTGTGAAPVVAALAKELGALTVAVVTKPFTFEGPQRKKMAERGLTDLASTVDTVISIPNDRLLELLPRGTSFVEAFRTADDVLRQGVQGISDIITTPGLINRDFSDVKAIMLGMGFAMLGTAAAKGENAAVEAARRAISCPLLEEGGVIGARGLLINFTATNALGIHDVNEACSLIREATQNDDVQLSFGVVLNESMGDEVKITVIATGFLRENLPEIERRPASEFIDESAMRRREAPRPQPVMTAPEPEREMEMAPEPVMAGRAQPAPYDYEDELEVPAFVRNERGGYK
ncbi:MAG: cell division protein FtsZ [Bryobacteraceae bacterium]|nr:cell division protein FtsZ [Bryobacteraceae bacterium]